MSGWDEGNVFYSDQDLVDQNAAENGLANRLVVQGKFKEFIRSFGELNGYFPYRYSFSRWLAMVGKKRSHILRSTRIGSIVFSLNLDKLKISPELCPFCSL